MAIRPASVPLAEKHQSDRIPSTLSPLARPFVPAHPPPTQVDPFFLSPVLAVTSPKPMLVPPLIPMFHDLGVVLLAGANAAGIRAPQHHVSHQTKPNPALKQHLAACNIRDSSLTAPEHMLVTTVVEQSEPVPTQAGPVASQSSIMDSHPRQESCQAAALQNSTSNDSDLRPSSSPVGLPNTPKPRSAWRVVGGGVMMSSSRPKNRVEEDASEQELISGSTEHQSTNLGVSAQHTGDHARSDYLDAVAKYPAHDTSIYFSSPSPLPFMYATTTPPNASFQQYTGPPVRQFAVQSQSQQSFEIAAEPSRDWAGWTMQAPQYGQPQLFYAAVPAFASHSLVYVLPEQMLSLKLQEPAMSEHEQHQSPAPTLTLCSTTPAELMCGLTQDMHTADALVRHGLGDLCLDGCTAASSGLDSTDESLKVQGQCDAFDCEGTQSPKMSFCSYGHDGELALGLGVQGCVTEEGIVSSAPTLAPLSSTLAPSSDQIRSTPLESKLSATTTSGVPNHSRPALLTAKRSWADEVEEEDPQWTKIRSSADRYGCVTSPNSPQIPRRLFSAESP